jgi:DNA repair exonuclease SbcCD ATPase subunit
LRENEVKLQDVRQELSAAKDSIAEIDAKINKLQEEISKAQSTKTNIADNIELRQNQLRIKEIGEEIDRCDLDEAALAREQFNEKYAKSMRAENKQKAEVRPWWRLCCAADKISCNS